MKDEGYDVNIYTLKLKSLDEDLAKRNIDHAEWGHAIYALLTEMIKITESKLNVVLVRVEE